MNPRRLTTLKQNQTDKTGAYVLYWMQQAQRVHVNHALSHAIETANQKALPLLVVFGLTPSYPDANLRHYRFMLEGLAETKSLLGKLGITFILKLDSPDQAVMPLLAEADTLVMDAGYLKVPRQWRETVLGHAHKHHPHLQIDKVDTDLIVPVDVASDKAEYGAYTLRPKLKKLYPAFRDFVRLPDYEGITLKNIASDDDLLDIDALLERLPIDKTVSASPLYHGGYLEASRLMDLFIREKADHYHESNDPSTAYTSKLSMYLHFGQIAALELLERMFMALEQGHINGQGFDAFIEQLLVRRELAFNYVTYQKGYDVFETMTEPWAYHSMKAHENDFRPHLYDMEALAQSKTHDPYFNAAMTEMRITGYMHNYMRMYWAKKIIEWSLTHKDAYQSIITLNNKYFIDGRDPNSYAGVAWCFGKHDRPWTERPIFGKLRYMNDKGLERKFNIQAYVDRINTLTENNT
ncbi:MAG: deoxyribodipyrimidine photolyase [Acholeplasmataceae bacterium]|nr:MAG: deoxyribodipyrimidine photolyase [Acholeplasmataceae bacterium]